MRTFLWVVLVFDQLFILLIGSVRLDLFEVSDFTMKQELAHQSGQSAKLRRMLHRYLAKVRLLQKTELIIAFTILASLFTYLTGPFMGIIYSLLSTVLLVAISRLSFVQKAAHGLFTSNLEFVLRVAVFLQPLWVVVGLPKTREPLQPSSLPEFTDQLRRLPSTIISPVQRQRLETVLESEAKTVTNIMTPKKRIFMVEPSATLGPVVLSDLEKSGHGHFPVATKKGEPEGILSLSDVADIHQAKQRSTVRDLMSSHITWVEESTSLYELTQALLHDKQYLALVRDEEGAFSGMVTIADLMKHLVGIVKD